MVFWISVVVIFLISFFLALRSLFSEIEKSHHLTKIHKKLKEEKVLFRKD